MAFLSQNPNDIPFDTRTFRTIIYAPDKLEDLKEKITNLLSIKKTLKKTSGTPLPYFDILYDKKRMIDERRGISEPVSEIFIGSKYEPSEFLTTNNQENLSLIGALPDLFRINDVTPRRKYFEISSNRGFKIQVNSKGFLNSQLSLRSLLEDGYNLHGIMIQLAELLFFIVRVLDKKNIKNKQKIKLDLIGLSGKKIKRYYTLLRRVSMTHMGEYSFSTTETIFSYEEEFEPEISNVFKVLCKIYKEICLDLGIIGLGNQEVENSVKAVIKDAGSLRYEYKTAGLRRVTKEEIFGI